MTWTQATVMRAVKAALEPAIGGRLHGLRRSAATHLAQQGETPMRIARLESTEVFKDRCLKPLSHPSVRKIKHLRYARCWCAAPIYTSSAASASGRTPPDPGTTRLVTKGEVKMAKTKNTVARSAQGLRDALFAEIEELRSGEGNPTKAQAVAKLAAQIINITKTEIEFHESVIRHAQNGHALALGEMPLGIAASASTSATAP